MKVILLAAGQGKRMRPASLSCPKPLLYLGDKRLIEYHLINLATAGYKDIIINISYRSHDFITSLGYGKKYGVKITYLFEPPPGYETGGTVINALDLLQKEPFLMLSADIYTNYPLEKLKKIKPKLAHLILTPPGRFNLTGDFNFINNKITNTGNHTYANIGVFNPAIFHSWPKNCRIPLKNIIKPLIKTIGLDASLLDFSSYWHNITTCAQLNELSKQLYNTTN